MLFVVICLSSICNFIAEELKETKSMIIREAVQQYIEDKLDYLSDVKAMRATESNNSLEEVLEEFKDEL